MFFAAGSSVAGRIVWVDLNAPLALTVPFHTPTTRTADPATSVAPGIEVLTEKLQLPAGNPVPPARSWMNPRPTGVEPGVADDVFWWPGLNWWAPVEFAAGVVFVAVSAPVGTAFTSRHEPVSAD